MTAALLSLLLAVAAGNPVEAAAPPATPTPSAQPQEPAWLGVFTGDAIDGGVQLIAIVPGGPAQEAGLLPGDLLIRLDGRPVPDREAVEDLVRRFKPGDRLPAEILRGGRLETRWIVAAGRKGPAWARVVPDSEVREPTGPSEGGAGLGLVEIPDALRLHYGAPSDRGVLVTAVEPGGPGARAGLAVGDVIVGVNGRPARTPDDVEAQAARRMNSLEIVRAGARRVLKAPGPALATTARTEEAPALEAEIEALRARIRELEKEIERLRREKVE